MDEMPEPRPRQRLLDAAIAHVAEHGIGDLSLRQLAVSLGTSHRMLIHHFGSKEQLWLEIVQAVEQRQRELFSRIAPAVDSPPGLAMRSWWKHISNPALWPNERLFFELYANALQGRAPATKLLEGLVDDWVNTVAGVNEANGMAPAQARAHARLGIAVTRGLLLDLVATGDVSGVDAAFEAFVGLYESWLAR